MPDDPPAAAAPDQEAHEVPQAPPGLARSTSDPGPDHPDDLPSPLLGQLHHPEALGRLLESGADPNASYVHEADLLPSADARQRILMAGIYQGAPTESLRLLLDWGAELCDPWDTQTPIGSMMHGGARAEVFQLFLGIPYPMYTAAGDGLRCFFCDLSEVDSCWWKSMSSQRPVMQLQSLLRLGYPARQPQLQEALDWLEDAVARPGGASETEQRRAREKLELLRTVNPESQSRRRQDYLTGFWSELSGHTGLSGVVSSLALQAMVPEFQLRIA